MDKLLVYNLKIGMEIAEVTKSNTCQAFFILDALKPVFSEHPLDKLLCSEWTGI